jgi:conserved oligomeric Golgi complex subunit 6
MNFVWQAILAACIKRKAARSTSLPCQIPAIAMNVQVFEGICRPLRLRIEQLLLTSTSLILTFRILQLLALSALMGADTALTGVLRAVRDQASNNFREQMKRRTDKLLRSVPSAPRDLSCAPEITEIVDVLLQVVDEFKRSMSAGVPSPLYHSPPT